MKIRINIVASPFHEIIALKTRDSVQQRLCLQLMPIHIKLPKAEVNYILTLLARHILLNFFYTVAIASNQSTHILVFNFLPTIAL